MRVWLAAALMVIGTASAAPASTVAARCPGYSAQLEQARQSLVRRDRSGAIAALKAAQAALGDCIRRDAEGGNAPILMVGTDESLTAPAS